MYRHSVYHFVTVFVSGWLVFYLHTCTAGRPVREDMRVGEISVAPTVQVGLGAVLREKSARIAVFGPYRIMGPDGLLAEGEELEWIEAEVRSNDEILLGEGLVSESPVTILPEVDGSVAVEYTKTWRGKRIRRKEVRYHGSLIIHSLRDGKLAVVNEVDLEDYLKGVVGKEMHLSEGEEALKTQVIAARTYAVHEQRLQRLRRIKGEKFDLYDDERSQVYGGQERETALATRLVDETRGMFLVYEGRLVRTFYSSTCGGYTEPAWEILQDETERIPPLAGVKCGYCERRSTYRWSEPLIIEKREIAEKCLPPDLRPARVRSVEITKTLPGGHALEVAIRLENSARAVRLHANNGFRRKVSPRFRSTLWEKIEDRGDTIAIFGRGFGHGAGMCQVGAYEMAKDGKTSAEVLEYYFPGARVKKLY